MPRWTPLPSIEWRRLAACGLVLLFVMHTPVALAATPEDRRAARVHFQAAEKAYAAESYEEALAGYEQAHALFPSPAFLFNMAQCHRHLNQPKEALALYQRYLEASPKAGNRVVVEGFISEMETAVAALPPEPILLPSEDVLKEEPPVYASAPSTKPVHEQWWFWTAAAVVVGGVAGGVVLASQAGGSLPPATLGDVSLR